MQKPINKIKLIGFNFLHRHPKTERLLDLPEEHVIVDKKDWTEIIEFFEEYPKLMSEVGKKELKPLKFLQFIGRQAR